MRNVLAATALAVATALISMACNSQESNNAAAPEPAPAAAAGDPSPAADIPTASNGLVGTVVETMDTGGYTYVQVDTGAEKIWAAAPQFAVAVGDEVGVPTGMPMEDYHSKTLDRTFDVVYFAGAITPAGAAESEATGPAGGMPEGHPGGSPIASGPTDVDLSGIEEAEGGQTVGELLADAETFSGEEIRVRGKVVKFNGGILGKNWVHVRDGTGEPGQDDLTVTTDAVVEVGDTVLVRGVAATDRDFGYGYQYAFIVEEAEVVVE